MGRNRTGVTTPAKAAELAAAVARRSGLVLRGLQAYAGGVQHIEAYQERAASASTAMTRIREARDAMKAAGRPPEIVTGGGTGSYDLDGDAGVFTDFEVGSYVFMDVEYNRVRRRDGTSGPFRTSLFVQSTVISANLGGQVTTDAGFKTFAMDGPKPLIESGAPAGSQYIFMGDEHGCIMLPEGANGLEVGTVVTCVTPHCDPTVNLYDFYHCVRGDTLVDIWRVDTRGRTW
jgi:D-serine deaminase-like pyridoxal phosphate-dependent protein